ncbi:MAG: serine/threonine protein kinase [Planctomycetes bacterium]|nr:serine/threonine protein kinase [Planctomycetota bacterium]
MSLKSTFRCLTVATLDQLAHDELSPTELIQVEEHVGGCEQCRQLLASAEVDAQWQEEICPILRTPSDFADAASEQDESTAGSHGLESVLRLLGPTDDPRMLGRIGTYEIVGVVGHGGMGVVFKAFDAPLNRFVAIKLLLPHLAASGSARRRFAREGQAAAAVIDDHVLPIYSVAEWQGIPYLVTQYSRGTTLQKRIQEQGPLELKEILRIGLQTARGLAAAHAQGLVHRDVKPSNILLDGTVERAMLTDFGLARAVDDATLTRTGIISGTPQYMSPEQAGGDAVDHRSDLFSLGSVLYAMCTGRPPFRADTTFGILRRIRETSPSPIREINADIPQWLERIVLKLLSKETSERYPTATEVATLLEHCLAHVQQPTAVPLPKFCRTGVLSFVPSTSRRVLRLVLPTTVAVVALLAIGFRQIQPGRPGPTSTVVPTVPDTPTPADQDLLWDSVAAELQQTSSALDSLERSSRLDLAPFESNPDSLTDSNREDQ